MLTVINPKLPMRDKVVTREFYTNKLGFKDISAANYDGYLIMQKDSIEIHFFEFKELNPKENYGQVYIRTNDIDTIYHQMRAHTPHLMPLENKPWGQKEFALVDPDNNLLTFGQSI